MEIVLCGCFFLMLIVVLDTIPFSSFILLVSAASAGSCTRRLTPLRAGIWLMDMLSRLFCSFTFLVGCLVLLCDTRADRWHRIVYFVYSFDDPEAQGSAGSRCCGVDDGGKSVSLPTKSDGSTRKSQTGNLDRSSIFYSNDWASGHWSGHSLCSVPHSSS